MGLEFSLLEDTGFGVGMSVELSLLEVRFLG